MFFLKIYMRISEWSVGRETWMWKVEPNKTYFY